MLATTVATRRTGGEGPVGMSGGGGLSTRGSSELLPYPSTLPAAGVYGRRRDLGPAYRQATPSRSPSSIFANDDTRSSFVFAAPVRGRRAV
eukprot:scaffold54878_cov67-Phaeocystis_antarctica.AAC.2